MRGPTLVLTVLVGVLAGCKGNPTCEKFVDMSMKCPGTEDATLTADERSQTKELLAGMCQNAMDDSTFGTRNDREKKMMKEMNATIRKKAECVAAAASCEDAKKCDASDP